MRWPTGLVWEAICQTVAQTAGKNVSLAQGMLKRGLRRSESRARNAIQDDRDEMSHRKAMEEAGDERALIEGMIWEMVEANETPMTAQNIVLGT
jgi:hypothetical protein